MFPTYGNSSLHFQLLLSAMLAETRRTKNFSVYGPINIGQDTKHYIADSFKIVGPCNKSFLKQSKASIEQHGFCICKHLISNEVISKTWKVLSKLSRRLIKLYDFVEDQFDGVDQEELCITRMPRIGKGKHNIHFEPQFSPQHEALVNLARVGAFADILSHYSNRQYSLRETGFSLTRPSLKSLDTCSTLLIR
jgi:hypothetical protein